MLPLSFLLLLNALCHNEAIAMNNQLIRRGHGHKYQNLKERNDEYAMNSFSAMENPNVDNKKDDFFGSNDDESDDTDSRYSDKKQKVALLLSIFVGGTGAGRWYIGEYVGASCKLILFILVFISPCILGICIAAGLISGEVIRGGAPDYGALRVLGAFGGATFGGVCIGCLCCALFIWCITDIALFAMNDIEDGNGLTLSPM